MTTPQEFICPISMEVMTDPVLCEDGHTYERRIILEWLRQSPTSPITRQPLSGTVHPNFALKAAIERWKKTNPVVVTPPIQPPTSFTYIPPQPTYQTVYATTQIVPRPPQPLQQQPQQQTRKMLLFIACGSLLVLLILSVVLSANPPEHTDDDY